MLDPFALQNQNLKNKSNNIYFRNNLKSQNHSEMYISKFKCNIQPHKFFDKSHARMGSIKFKLAMDSHVLSLTTPSTQICVNKLITKS